MTPCVINDLAAYPAFKAAESGTDPSNPAVVRRIQSDVTGMGLAKRVLLVTLVAAGMLTFLCASGYASPIRPDVKKLLSQPPAQMPPYVPARAGWNGPELSTSRSAPNPTYESLSPENSAREVRESLMATVIPDFRVIALLALVILLLRRMRKYTPMSVSASSMPVDAQPIVSPPVLTSEAGEARPAA